MKINRSIVERAFNKIREEHNEETAKALYEIADQIEMSEKSEAFTNFNKFNEELLKSKPRKSILRFSWIGITNELPSLLQMVSVNEKISKLFAV